MNETQNVFLVNVYTYDAQNKHVNTFIFTTSEAARRAALEIELMNSKLNADVLEQRVFTSFKDWDKA